MHADLILFAFVLLFGCVAFLFGIVYLVGRLIGAVFRGLWRLGAGGDSGQPCVMTFKEPPPRICPNPRCGKAERRPARFCSHCGTRMLAGQRTSAL